MKDFLRAEWKTLLVAGLGFAVLWAVFFQREAVRVPEHRVEPTVVPGERLGELHLAATPAEVEAILGPPDDQEPEAKGAMALGMTRWRYPTRGLTLTWYDGRLVAIRLDVHDVEPRPQLVLPSGEDLAKNLPAARRRLGKALLQKTTDEGLMTRHPGLILIAANAKAREARAVTVVDDRVSSAE